MPTLQEGLTLCQLSACRQAPEAASAVTGLSMMLELLMTSLIQLTGCVDSLLHALHALLLFE
jgi:hypothetical protein